MTVSIQTTTVSTKGQVILPKTVRNHLGWDSGTRLTVEPVAEGVLLKPLLAAFPPARSADVFACLAGAGPAKTLAQMEAGIAAEAKRRHAGGRY